MTNSHHQHVEQSQINVNAYIDSMRADRCQHRECSECRKVERHLDMIQSEIELLLRRTSPVPARITLRSS